ncbi:hypothetical protein ABEB36_006689 [Hypothenemus hampei]|uniref:Origin recognition complex subunit 4 n=1 Tax=Hypothenemus hampei TaxID=57062 RepID=A0ABD1ERF4_HYPHA
MTGNDIVKIREFLKDKLFYNEELFGKEAEKNQVFELLRRTAVDGESNSMLLIGPNGSGKTTLINKVLKELQLIKTFHSDCIIVKLHGLVHTDDRLALKSITFQMNLDNAVDGKVFGSFAENLAFLLACLRTGERRSSKSVIFILEEFDLFCAHHNQTLLYNLFDVAQSAQAPICVLGITCRNDVIQLLEKRVKSRFSHRQLFLYPISNENSDTSDLDYTLNKLKWYLELPDKNEPKISSVSRKQWNSHINSLLGGKKFQNLIQRMIDLEFNQNCLKNILVKCVFSLSETNGTLTCNHFEKELDLLEKDDMIQVILDLTALEICLIIAMKHHQEIYDRPMNFEMIFSRYVKFVNKHSNMQNIQRPVVMKAFEHIEKLELISMLNQAGSSKLQKEYQFFKLLVAPTQISEAVGKYIGLPTEIIQWCNSSLV